MQIVTTCRRPIERQINDTENNGHPDIRVAVFVLSWDYETPVGGLSTWLSSVTQLMRR